jgi:hypothetical protein
MVSTRGDYDFCMGPYGDISQIEPWCDIHHDLKESHIPMQSTGIKDYLDKEIYEGDVLFIYIDTPTFSNHYYLVEDARTFLMYYGYINASVRKISNDGNIYEQPALLEKAKCLTQKI